MDRLQLVPNKTMAWPISMPGLDPYNSTTRDSGGGTNDLSPVLSFASVLSLFKLDKVA